MMALKLVGKMPKNNPAISFYIQAWQQFIHSIPAHQNPDTWHKCSTNINGNPIEMSALAWRDLGKALEQYREWQTTPLYVDDQPIIWREGGTQLLDFGGEGTPVLMVPSMINGHEILHMPQPANLAEYLREKGLHPLLLDWGKDVEADRNMGVQDYQQRLQSVSKFIGKSGLLGYCLGGTLAHFTPLENIKRQVLIGVPWKFQSDQGRVGAFNEFLLNTPIDQLMASFENTTQHFGLMPSIYIDYLFACLNPLQFIQKFRLRDTKDNLILFDAIEDWLNTGRNLPKSLSEEILFNWYREDAIIASNYQNHTPSLAVFGSRDHIAPPKSCTAIAHSGQNMQLLEHDAGHVGLLAGKQSQSTVWPKIADFLNFEIK